MKRLQILLVTVVLTFVAAIAAQAQTDTTQTITQTGNYRITVRGADGGRETFNSITGGSGATVSASFALQAGDSLNLVTGVAGGAAQNGGGGGGGSAVILTRGATQTLLIAAGGGGGGAGSSNGFGGSSAQGTAGGGAAGSLSGGGGGFNSNGGNSQTAGGGAGTLAGGGAGNNGANNGGNGGYGFGGGSGAFSVVGGAGGGYQGGAGQSSGAGGNGGLSFVDASGTNPARTDGANGSGNGQDGQNGSVSVAQTFSYVVTKTADTNDGVCDADCSLREAIAAAVPGSTIIFASPLFDSPQVITLTSGELLISKNLTVNGTGANLLSISGNNQSRVFYLDLDADLTVNGVTITKGNGAGTTTPALNGTGGGIFSYYGKLTLTNSIISNNIGSEGGGGIYNALGTLTLTKSTVRDNTSDANNNGCCGGITNDNGTVTIIDSTVSGNSSFYGGGIYNLGTMTLVNTTVSGNVSTGNSAAGGIINSAGTLNLTNVTVTENKSNATNCFNCAGGIVNFDTVNLKNTIVAKNIVVDATAPPDFRGAVAAGSSYNLVGNGQEMTGIANNDANHNQVGVDPKLGSLASNGGATQTHALQTGSPAIDAGDDCVTTNTCSGVTLPSALTTDQRGAGYARKSGTHVDIGAFEVQLGATAATVSISGRVTTADGRGIKNIRLSLSDSLGQIRTATTTSFGYYRFDDVQTGKTYILEANGKHFTFSQSVQVLNINEETDQVNFIANAEKRLGTF